MFSGWWKSKSKIIVPDENPTSENIVLDLLKVKNFVKIWDSINAPARWGWNGITVSFFRPFVPDGWYFVGDIIVTSSDRQPPPTCRALLVRETKAAENLEAGKPLLAVPVSYELVWDTDGYKCSYGDVAIWRAIPPYGFASIGFVVTTGVEDIPQVDPAFPFRCVHLSVLLEGSMKECIWKAPKRLKIWRIVPLDIQGKKTFCFVATIKRRGYSRVKSMPLPRDDQQLICQDEKVGKSTPSMISVHESRKSFNGSDLPYVSLPYVFQRQKITILGTLECYSHPPIINVPCSPDSIVCKFNYTTFHHSSIPSDRWMECLSDIIGKNRLIDVAIPGTHDSVTHTLTGRSPAAPDAPAAILRDIDKYGIGAMAVKSVIAGWSRAQEVSVLNQLMDGIRYLDLRICLNRKQLAEMELLEPLTKDNALVQSARDVKIRPSTELENITVEDGGDAAVETIKVSHVRSASAMYLVHGLYGPSIESVLEDVKTFLLGKPKEIIILDFNHFYQMTLESHLKLHELLFSVFGSMIAPPEMCPTDTFESFWAKGYQIICTYEKRRSPFTAGFLQEREKLLKNIATSVPVSKELYSKYLLNLEELPSFKLWGQSKIISPWPNTTDLTRLLDQIQKGIELEFNQRVIVATGGKILPRRNKKKDIARAEMAAKRLHVTQGVLTPDGKMIQWGFSPGCPSTLTAVADVVNASIVRWIKELPLNYPLNIVIVDHYHRCGLVQTILRRNVLAASATDAEDSNAPLPPLPEEQPCFDDKFDEEEEESMRELTEEFNRIVDKAV